MTPEPSTYYALMVVTVFLFAVIVITNQLRK